MQYIEGHKCYWCMLEPDHGRSQSLRPNLLVHCFFLVTHASRYVAAFSVAAEFMKQSIVL